MTLPSEGEGIVILTNGDGGGAINEEMKCAWVGWATGRTIPECVNMGLANDALIAMGVWLVLVLGVVLRGREAAHSPTG